MSTALFILFGAAAASHPTDAAVALNAGCVDAEYCQYDDERGAVFQHDAHYAAGTSDVSLKTAIDTPHEVRRSAPQRAAASAASAAAAPWSPLTPRAGPVRHGAQSRQRWRAELRAAAAPGGRG